MELTVKKDKSIIALLLGGLFSSLAEKKFLDYLEKEATKLVIKTFFKNAALGGFKSWLVRFVVGEMIDLSDEKIIEPIFRSMNFVRDVKNGKVTYTQVVDAKDIDSWRDAVRDV